MKTFFFPEKPLRIKNIRVVPDNYFMEVKKNGHRVEVIADEKGIITLKNRYGEILKAGQQFKWDWLKEIYDYPFYLDGEMVGVRQKGDVSDTIVIWDTITIDGELLLDRPCIERYKLLVKDTIDYSSKKTYGTKCIAREKNTVLCLSEIFPLESIDEVWNNLDNVYDEGLVFKNPLAKLDWNINATKHSANQLKLKVA